MSLDMDIVLVQMCSGLDPEANLEKIKKLIGDKIRNHPRKIQGIYLPECFLSLSNGLNASPYLVQWNQVTENKCTLFCQISDLARFYQCPLIGGSVATETDEGIKNRSLIINESGELVCYYDKIHLFRCQLPDKLIDESQTYCAGSIPKLTQMNHTKIGLSICFDLRFPELYRYYHQQGVQIITIPSAFTVPTGRAHWHALVRARAIENQSFVIAPAQWGENHSQTQTYGHSLVVGPWGDILFDAQEGERAEIVTIDLREISKVKSRMNTLPQLNHHFGT